MLDTGDECIPIGFIYFRKITIIKVKMVEGKVKKMKIRMLCCCLFPVRIKLCSKNLEELSSCI